MSCLCFVIGTLIISGVPFFIGCIAYNVVAAGAARPRMLLQVLVVAGAVLQVFGKAAKFSCFKPCEEMVYIGLDEESRTKGVFSVVMFLGVVFCSLEVYREVFLAGHKNSLSPTTSVWSQQAKLQSTW